MTSNYDLAAAMLARYTEVVAAMTPETVESQAFALSVAMQTAQVYALLAVADALMDAKAPE